MWVITVFLEKQVRMFEYNCEEDARKAMKRITEPKILTGIM
ncbi:hypothetical protein [Peribacillus asahii]